jgi:hypothetical protein
LLAILVVHNLPSILQLGRRLFRRTVTAVADRLNQNSQHNLFSGDKGTERGIPAKTPTEFDEANHCHRLSLRYANVVMF